jgi:3-hydroxybutyryl-CoA dehydrogenase
VTGIGRSDLVAVVGAGTMGAGIAQVAAVAGHPVIVHDAVQGVAARAVAAVRHQVARLVEKGRLDVDPSGLQLTVAREFTDLAPARCVIEAVAEDLAVKQALFADLEKVVAPDCVLATNTSSLSPTAIAAGLLSDPGRVVGLHFFNPAPVMRLVEVVSGLATDPAVAAAVTELAQSWGKQVVQAAATPGFIVNRVARPFYAEALRLAEEQAACPATIDAVLTQAGGFRMGPFALMDLVGQDVNEAVTRSVWTAFGNDPRFAPSPLQRALVEAGRLGRKTGRGWFRYGDDAPPVDPDAAPDRPGPAYVTEHGESPVRILLGRSGVPVRPGAGRDGTVELPGGALLLRCDGRPATALAAERGQPVVVVDRALDDATATGIAIAASEGCPALGEAAGLLQAAGLTVYVIDDAPGLVVTRTVAMLVNGAVDAMHKGVASAADIDTAMRLGTNYPLGPLAWGDRWGPAAIVRILDAMQAWYGEDRYRPSALLRRIAAAGGDLREMS